MRKLDSLKQFIALRDFLQKEKAEIEVRLAEINQTLGESERETRAGTRADAIRTARGSHRIQNPISLPKAVLQVTSKRPLTKPEILSELHKLGYRFAAKDPINSLNTLLYSKPSKFKNDGGKFSALRLQATRTGAARADKGDRKRKMSPEARAKIAAAAKARWAKIKAVTLGWSTN